MKKLFLVFVALSGWALSSCANLKTFNTFSKSATAALRQGTTLPVTFTEVYRQRMLEDSLARHPFNRIPVVGIDFASRVGQDSLRSYQLADSLLKNGTELLTNYFQALTDLSVTGSAAPTVRLESPTFESYLQNSALKLTAGQVVSFNRIVNVVASAATGTYRRAELIDLLEQSHNDVRQMMRVLIFAHERLADVVDISRDQRYGYYKNRLIRDGKLTYGQKQDLAQQWLQTANDIGQNRQAILTHVKTLRTIYAGYDALYLHRNELNSKALLTSIQLYVSTLQQLQTDLEQLKPVYGRLYPGTDR